MEVQNFTRYRDQGPYHWRVFDRWSVRGIRGFDARLAARYDIAVRAIEEAGLLNEPGLDAGCGDGAGLYSLHLAGSQCTGVDGDQTAITLALEQGRTRGASLDARVGNLYQQPFADGQFGYAIMLDVIEHLDQPELALKELRRCVRPGGLVVITTPMELKPGTVQDRFHVREYTIDSLTALLAPHFSQVSVRGYAPRMLLNLMKSKRYDLPRRSALWTVKLAAAARLNLLSRITGKDSNLFGDLVAVCRV